MRSVSVNLSPFIKLRALLTVMSLISAMDTPFTVTARLSGFKRFPLHSGQGMFDIYASISCFAASDEVSSYLRSRLVITPSKEVLKVPLPNSRWYFTSILSSPVPYSSISCILFGSSPNGVSIEKP